MFGCSKHGFVGKQVVGLTVSVLEGLSDLVLEDVIGWVIGGVIGSVVKRTFAS